MSVLFVLCLHKHFCFELVRDSPEHQRPGRKLSSESAKSEASKFWKVKLTVNLAILVQGAVSEKQYPNINRDNTSHSHLTSQTNALPGTTTTASIHIVTYLDIEVFDN